MRPRTIHTKKLLAVAVTITASGCADRRPPAPLPEPTPIVAAPDAAPRAEAPSEPTPPASVATAVAAPIEPAKPASARAPSIPKREPSAALLALRDKLLELSRAQAQKQATAFRPLCDADGYPLVGNVVRKKPTLEPSTFCADVRERGGR